MDQIEEIVLQVDERPAVAGAARANAALDGVERKAASVSGATTRMVSDSANASVRQAQSAAQSIVTITDRSKSSIERLVAAAERQASSTGVSRIQQLAAQRDLTLGRVSGDPAAIERVTLAYQKLIAVQQQAEKSAASAQRAKETENLLNRAVTASQKAAAEAGKFEQALVRVNRVKLAQTQDLLERAIASSKKAAAETAKFEQELAKVNRTAQQGIATLERRATLATKSGKDRTLAQLGFDEQDALKKFGTNPANIQRIQAAFAQMRAEQEKQIPLSERLRYAIQNPLQAAGDGAKYALEKLGPLGVGLGIFGVTVGIVAERLFSMVEAQGKAAEQTINLADRLDITVDKAQELQIAANIAGVQIGSLEGSSKLLAAALEDQTGAGEKTAKALRLMGVSTVTLNGEQRESGQILIDVLDKLSQIPGQSERVARANAVLGKGSKELLPMIKNLAELSAIAEKLKVNPEFIKELAKADDKLDILGQRWNNFKTVVAAKVGIPIFDAITYLLDRVEQLPQTQGNGGFDQAEALSGRVPTNFGAFKAGSSESRSARQKQLEDIRHGTELQDQFTKRQIADVETINKRLTQVRKDRDEIENLLSGKSGQITGQAFESKKATFDGLERDIKQLEKLKKQIEAINARPEEIAKARAEGLKSSREGVLEGKAGLSGSDKFAGEVSRNFQKLAFDQQKDIEKASSIIDKNGVVVKFQADQEAITNIFTKYRLKRQQVELDALEVEYQKTLELIDKAQQDRLAVEQQDRAARAEIFHESEQLSLDTISRRLEFETTAAGYSRDQQLQQLELVNARTLSEKIAVEQQKAAIEETYLTQSNARFIQQLKNRTEIEIQERQTVLRLANASEEEIKNVRFTREQALNQSIIEADAKTNAAITASRNTAAIRSVDLIRSNTESVFDSIKRSSEGVFDSMLTKSQNIFQAMGSAFKNAVLTAVKEVVTSQVAASLTRLLTGQQVTFAGQGGTGPLGAIRAAAGRFGLGGTPTFGTPPFLPPGTSTSKLEQPNHIGDVRLNGGAVPVYILNQAQQSENASNPSARIPTLGAAAGLAGLVGMLAGGRGSSGGITGTAADSIIKSDAGRVIGGGTTTYPGTPPFAGGSGGSTGILSGLSGFGKSITGGLKSLGNLGTGAVTPGAGSTGAAQAVKGVGGVTGGLMLLGGGVLAADGLRRGGLVGLGETTAGGALIGAKFGGPIGALIGGAIGAAAGTIRLFIKGANEKAIQKVQDAYHLKIDKSLASQIVAISKQSYGGNLDMAIRSQSVRDLLQLYAMSTGQNFGVQAQMRSVSLSETSSGLQQNAIYENGRALSFSGIGVAGGIATTGIPGNANTSSATSATAGTPQTNYQTGTPITVVVQNQLPAASVKDYMNGQMVQTVTENPRVVSKAAAVGTKANAGRRDAQALLLAPGTLTA